MAAVAGLLPVAQAEPGQGSELLVLVFFFFSLQVCGVTASFGFSEFCWSFTLLLHHSHLLDAVVQVVGEFPLQVGLVLLWLEDILLPLSVILCSLCLVLQVVHEPLTRGDVT